MLTIHFGSLKNEIYLPPLYFDNQYEDMNQSEERLFPKTVITEDSGSGYDFFHSVCEENGIKCYFAGGKSKLRLKLEAQIHNKL